MLTGNHATLYDRLIKTIPKERLIHDDLRTLAYGTDASFYRLIPKLVVKTANEEEVATVLREASSLALTVTFRAAGTSLSGQAISDSVLVMLGETWTGYRISEDASTISLQPGIIGGHANQYLAGFGKKIGPDPASINAAMIGGIAANNASGMCCGTAQNSYNTLASMRIILSDGTLLDTGDPESRAEFLEKKKELIDGIRDLTGRINENSGLAERIRRKYKMKNTTGYSLNAFVDFEDPIDVIQHLMIGSEGTLGFIAEVTYNTVPELADKASSLMFFPDIETACKAVEILKECSVDAVELMDRASLRSVEDEPGMPDYLATLDESVAALLVESRAVSKEKLSEQIAEILKAIDHLPKAMPVSFTDVPEEFEKLWNIRKGLFPSVGAMRDTGTTVIIEDVAFPIPLLAEATLKLQKMLQDHGYDDAIIFGHALEGNLHFVFSQDFNVESEVVRYAAFIDEVTRMVVEGYDGSLKAEHGTGRNMAPFVELEWGTEAYEIMREIKGIFDPGNLLNPGVIINDDQQAHIKSLKPLPAAHPIVDKCTECGFCEVQCPSRNLTSTPRHRIVAYREISRLEGTGEDAHMLKTLKKNYDYFSNQTCATDGLCAVSCPVKIDTGLLIKDLRFQSHSRRALRVADRLADSMSTVTEVMRRALNTADLFQSLLGNRFMEKSSSLARKISGNRIPLWNKYIPKGTAPITTDGFLRSKSKLRAVYFPSCINRTMGISRDYDEKEALPVKSLKLLRKSGYDVVYPENLHNLCCGMAFDSKGFKEQGEKKARELESALLKASNGGKYPIYVDMSPCLFRMKETLNPKLYLFEPIEFILTHLAERLTFTRLKEPVVIHNTCSSTKMDLNDSFKKLAAMCAENVVVPEGVTCCGWAGDRGFSYPELTESALSALKNGIPDGCTKGYSTSRTCEIGLSLHSGISYKSIVYLVDTCTTPNK